MATEKLHKKQLAYTRTVVYNNKEGNLFPLTKRP